MHGVCSALKSVSPRRKTIAAMDISKLTDSILDTSIAAVMEQYDQLGHDDRVAKGKPFVEGLKNDLITRFGKYPGMPEPPDKQKAKKVIA